MKLIIRYFPEITIKSRPVRKRFVSSLQNNIIKRIQTITPDYKISVYWDFIELNIFDEKAEKEVIFALKKITGIANFSKVLQYDYVSFDDALEKTIDLYEDKIKGKTFKVFVKRKGTHDFKSIDAEKYIGGGLLARVENTKVDIRKPEVPVLLEIRDDKLYIVDEKIQGMGGYPVGVQDKVLSLISGGFDSPVASFELMKRGAKVDYLFFNLGGKAHELGVKQLSYYLWQHFSCSYSAKFTSVNFEEIVTELLTKIHHKFRGIILKRLMMKIGEMIATKYDYPTLATGEALGQVSSQTLTNLAVIDKSIETLTLRPLISFDKPDIIAISEKIGTYEYSANMPEYCGVVSEKPATGAKLEKVLAEEAKLSEGLLERAFETREINTVSKMMDTVNESYENEVVSDKKEDEIIIDIREDMKRNKNPLKQDSLIIPFFEINQKFPELDQSKTYLFYCDKGILSNLHALYLKDKGFNNIKVLRP